MRWLLILLCVTALTSCDTTELPAYRSWQQIVVRSGEQQWHGFVAATAEQQAHGLMQTPTLPAGDAVVFAFADSAPRYIWMKNTLIPLDVIWLDAEQVVVGADTLQPCSAQVERCPSFNGGGRATQFIIEIGAGEWHGQLGDQFELDKI